MPKYNICIEYDGKQHFEPIKYFGGITKFEYQKNNDQIKDDYCSKNGIRLMRLPYTLSKEDIKEKIISIKNPVTTTVV